MKEVFRLLTVLAFLCIPGADIFAQAFIPGKTSDHTYTEFSPKIGFGSVYFPCAAMLRTQFLYSWNDPVTGKTDSRQFNSGDVRFAPRPIPQLTVLDMEMNSVSFSWHFGVGGCGERLSGFTGYTGLGYNFYLSWKKTKKPWTEPLMITPFLDLNFSTIASSIGTIDNVNRDILLPNGDTSFYMGHIRQKTRMVDQLVVQYSQNTFFLVPSLCIRDNMHSHQFYIGLNIGYWQPIHSSGRLVFLANGQDIISQSEKRKVSSGGFTTWSNNVISDNPHAIRNGCSAMLSIGFSLD